MVSGGVRAVTEVSEGMTTVAVIVRGVEEARDKPVTEVDFMVVRGGKRVVTSAFQENKNQPTQYDSASSYINKRCHM